LASLTAILKSGRCEYPKLGVKAEKGGDQNIAANILSALKERLTRTEKEPWQSASISKKAAGRGKGFGAIKREMTLTRHGSGEVTLSITRDTHICGDRGFKGKSDGEEKSNAGKGAPGAHNQKKPKERKAKREKKMQDGSVDPLKKKSE